MDVEHIGDNDASSSFLFNDNSFSNVILHGLNNLRLEKKFFDMTICVGQETFHCHRVVLASASQYFRSMFGGMMRESFTDRVTIFDVDADIMEILIEFCYTGQVFITTDNVIHLLRSADLFEFVTVKDACCRFLENHFQVSNCINLHLFAESMSYQDLSAKAMEFMKKNIVPITKCNEFYHLNFSKIYELILSRNLNVSKEEHAYEIALSWIKYDVAKRGQYFSLLFKCIRVPFLRRIYILNRIEMNPFVRSSKICHQLIKEARAFHTCTLDRHENPSIRLQPRPSTGIAEIFVVFGGCDSNCDELGQMYYFNPHLNQWRYLMESPTELRGGFATTCLDNDIFVTGGSELGHPSNRVWRYKSLLNEWVEKSPMLYPQEYHGTAAIKTQLYVVGSENCECYHVPSDIWREIARMPEAVNNCSVAACQGKIYALGSQMDSMGSIVVQVYDPEIDKWEVLPWNLPESAFVPSISSLGGILYLFREDSKEVLAYNPKIDSWIENISPMPQLHLGGTISMYNGNLIVSGGYDNQFGLSDVIETYDPSLNVWKTFGCLPRPMFWQAAVSIFRFVSAPTGGNYIPAEDLHCF